MTHGWYEGRDTVHGPYMPTYLSVPGEGTPGLIGPEESRKGVRSCVKIARDQRFWIGSRPVLLIPDVDLFGVVYNLWVGGVRVGVKR